MGTSQSYPKELKEKVLSRINNDGLLPSEAASEAGIGVKPVYAWIKGNKPKKINTACCYCKKDFLPKEQRVETSLSFDTQEFIYHPKCWWSAMDDLEREDLAMKKLALSSNGSTPKLPPK